MEGIAYGVKHHLDEMSDIDIDVTNIVSIGGGTKSRLWTQIVSNVTEIKQKIISEDIGAHVGDCYLAGLGIKIFKGFDVFKIVGLNKIDRIITPNTINHKIYKDYYKIYRKLYTNNKEEMHCLTDLTS